MGGDWIPEFFLSYLSVFPLSKFPAHNTLETAEVIPMNSAVGKPDIPEAEKLGGRLLQRNKT